ncbi:MAG: NHL domain-containing protein [Candidatus Anammoxibacter sp.]
MMCKKNTQYRGKVNFMRNLIVSSVFLIALSCLFQCQEANAQIGIITTVASNGDSDSSVDVGDGGLATDAMLSFPSGVFVDNAGNIFIADAGLASIRKVDGATGIITTVAGNNGEIGFSGDGSLATEAILELGFPSGVFVDSAGSIFIADTN